jgi:hypothetical protein
MQHYELNFVRRMRYGQMIPVKRWQHLVMAASSDASSGVNSASSTPNALLRSELWLLWPWLLLL